MTPNIGLLKLRSMVMAPSLNWTRMPGVFVVNDRETWLQTENLLMTKQTLRGPGNYEPNRPTIIAADTSSDRNRAVLLQVQDDYKRRPVCYASPSLSDTEKRYAVIKKEAIAAT